MVEKILYKLIQLYCKTKVSIQNNRRNPVWVTIGDS